jgi:hypothetical protein
MLLGDLGHFRIPRLRTLIAYFVTLQQLGGAGSAKASITTCGANIRCSKSAIPFHNLGITSSLLRSKI